VLQESFKYLNIHMYNPLLEPFNTPFQLPPFDQIEIHHYQPAIEEAIKLAKTEIETIVQNPQPPTFGNTIEALELSGKVLSRIAPILFNLNSAETSEELQQVAQVVSPLLTSFDSEVKQNKQLFERIELLVDQKDQLDLDQEQSKLLEKTYLGFKRSGAGLSSEKQQRFQEIAVELSKLQLSFGENVLAETNNFSLHITDEDQLSGLPEDYKARAAALAKEKGNNEGWLITLQAPSYIPFMEYADNRQLREQLYRAYMTKAFKKNEFDNRTLLQKIVKLRNEMAGLLGYESYASYVLEQRMAGNPKTVDAFLNQLLDKALSPAREEIEELREFMKEIHADHELERWDWAYYSEKLRKKKYDLDDELIKPYFKLENVIDGIFETASKLYGLTFRPNADLPIYHEDVKAYEVHENGQLKSIFYADFFPRKGKRPGAWMTSFRDQQKCGEEIIPVISIVCNFTPSTDQAPSLLKFDEVTTFFHEFGHALHGMLSNVNYSSLSGTSVHWDFVELPSQIFENWCYEKECLDLFARHHVTGEAIPQNYIDRIKASSNYHEAYATVRQLSFGLLDMAYHQLSDQELMQLDDIEIFEQQAMKQTELFPSVPDTNMSVQFSHIFAGGYASGYYSYKWAEVLDADAFEVFSQNGIFDPSTAAAFKEHILSKGGTEDPVILYRNFRGKDPDPGALLKRAGLA
jgi:peptidyl-dipeptidase Dcp